MVKLRTLCVFDILFFLSLFTTNYTKYELDFSNSSSRIIKIKNEINVNFSPTENNGTEEKKTKIPSDVF